jgi:tetratricopeptide (TPR) repeat protein
VPVGRFVASQEQRVPDANYIERRTAAIGSRAAKAAAAAARRLELALGPIASQFFPDLHFAWLALAGLPDRDLPWDCVVIDECQDLTPIECFFLARLTKRLTALRGRPVNVLLAGDEAQTVRPTDFEWGWLNDIFHQEVATPSVENLTANLRSPRKIAELVNSVWELYGHLDRRDRPAGQGLATIDDHAADQILYCAAPDGEDLTALISTLSDREGLAMVTFDESHAVCPQALTASEIKGLDFQSVCLINPGEQLEQIRQSTDGTAAAIGKISRRLAIDRLRVAVSRPTERLIFLDIGATDVQLHASLDFLHSTMPELAALTPAALLKSIQEENLDLEERIQRCQEDARQYLPVRPDLAWSRAHQAVSLLGKAGDLAAVEDPHTRRSAHLTLAEVCFSLAMREQKLPPELGKPDLLKEAAMAAERSETPELATVLYKIAEIYAKTGSEEEVDALIDLVGKFPSALPQLPPWVLLELGGRPGSWISTIENLRRVGIRAVKCAEVLPVFCEALNFPDAAERCAQFLENAIDFLMRQEHFREALMILSALREKNHHLEAQCHQRLGDFVAAATAYRTAGDLQKALECYRRIPDIDQALAVIAQMGEPADATASLKWIATLRNLAADCPVDFQFVITQEERKLLEAVLQPIVGGQGRRIGGRRK